MSRTRHPRSPSAALRGRGLRAGLGLVTATSLLLWLWVRRGPSGQVVLPRAERPDQALFCAVLEQNTRAAKGPLVIAGRTLQFRGHWDETRIRLLRMANENPELEALAERCLQENRKPASVRPFTCPASPALIPGLDVDLTFRNGWAGFRTRYPGADGIIQFSVPAYSNDERTALLCFAYDRGPKAGYRAFILLRFKDGAWIEEDRDYAVVSHALPKSGAVRQPAHIGRHRTLWSAEPAHDPGGGPGGRSMGSSFRLPHRGGSSGAGARALSD